MMMMKKNDVDLKAFGKINWKKEGRSRISNVLHNKILAWLLNPYGDHGLERWFLEQFLSKAGLRPSLANKVQSVSHNKPIDAYARDKRIDGILELPKAYLLIENKLDLPSMDGAAYIEELRNKTMFLTDDLRRGKTNRIILLSPSDYIPPPLGEYLKTNSYIARMSYTRYIAILGELLLYEVRFNTDKKFYCALEQYKMFLQMYVLDIYHESQRDLRLKNIKAIV